VGVQGEGKTRRRLRAKDERPEKVGCWAGLGKKEEQDFAVRGEGKKGSGL